MLAMYVVLENYLQMVYDYPAAHEGDRVLNFTEIPTTWDETKVPNAEVSDYIQMQMMFQQNKLFKKRNKTGNSKRCVECKCRRRWRGCYFNQEDIVKFFERRSISVASEFHINWII